MRSLFRRLIAYALFPPFFVISLFHPKLRKGARQRMGVLSVPQKTQRRIWLHGASAGDMLALRPLAICLKKEDPNIEIVATTITNSGYTMATQYPGVFDHVYYAPYDVYGCAKRSVRTLKADALVLEYTELWPEMLAQAEAARIPVFLHNGRLSEDKIQHYRRLFFWVGNLLQGLSLLCMRDESEAERAIDLGARASSVIVTGNSKFDNLLSTQPTTETVEDLKDILKVPGNVPIWVAGSTHEGEEADLFDIFSNLRSSAPKLRLILAPRYPERAPKLCVMAQDRKLKCATRSAATSEWDVMIIDTIGELMACYTMADIVFVGGSFVERGGQNILEPAICAKPVLFGPNMKNFADSVQVLLGRGGIQVSNPAQLERVLRDLLSKPEKMQQLGREANTRVSQISGAAERAAAAMLSYLKENGPLF